MLGIALLNTGCWTDIAYDPSTELSAEDEQQAVTIDQPLPEETIIRSAVATKTTQSSESASPAPADSTGPIDDFSTADDPFNAESFGAELAAAGPVSADAPSVDESAPTPSSEPTDRYAPLPWEIDEKQDEEERDTNEPSVPSPADEPQLATTVDDSLEVSESEDEDATGLDWLTDASELSTQQPDTTDELKARDDAIVNPTLGESTSSPYTQSLEEPPKEISSLPWEASQSGEVEQSSDENLDVEPLPLPLDLTSEDDVSSDAADLDGFEAIELNSTRHLTWVVSTELSTALVNRDRKVTDVANNLSQHAAKLGIDLQKLSLGDEVSSGSTAKQLLTLGRQLGELVSKQHDREHAALVEVAFKSQLLVAVLPTKPNLKGAINDSIAAAAERARLPRTVWEPWRDGVAANSDDTQISQLVEQLHTAVAAELRTNSVAPEPDSSPMLR